MTNPDVEHNTAVLKRLLHGIGEGLANGSDLINSLSQRSGTLTGQAAAAAEFAVATEQTSNSKTALDEASGLAATMDQHLGTMSTAVVTAEESVAAAITALAVVDAAEDELRQAGAGTRAVAPARDGA